MESAVSAALALGAAQRSALGFALGFGTASHPVGRETLRRRDAELVVSVWTIGTHSAATMGTSRVLAVVMAATLSSPALSACPNMCSGHGTCGDDNVCACEKDYGAGDEQFGDCSQMFCPYEVSIAL